ncbi:MAG: hypothetical protein J7539_09465 [Niabella sp.]|nr:hypothetical protein [Niabella sp.]
MTEIRLNEVFTLSYLLLLLIIVAIACPLFLAAGLFIYPILGIMGLLFSTLLIFFFTYFCISKFRKNLVIRITGTKVLIEDEKGSPVREFANESILGFFTYDYLKKKRSLIYFKFLLKDGSRFEIIDSKISDKFDPVANKLLSKAVEDLRSALNMTLVEKNKLRSFLKIGDCRFSIDEMKNIY